MTASIRVCALIGRFSDTRVAESAAVLLPHLTARGISILACENPGDIAGAYTRADRAKRLLGWQAKYDITEGIRHSLQWAAIRDEMLCGDGDTTPPRISAGDERV